MPDKNKEFNDRSGLREIYDILGETHVQSEERRQTEAALKRLKTAAEADPGWEKAIKSWAEDEARCGKDDPCEGKIVILPKPPGK